MGRLLSLYPRKSNTMNVQNSEVKGKPLELAHQLCAKPTPVTHDEYEVVLSELIALGEGYGWPLIFLCLHQLHPSDTDARSGGVA